MAIFIEGETKYTNDVKVKECPFCADLEHGMICKKTKTGRYRIMHKREYSDPIAAKGRIERCGRFLDQTTGVYEDKRGKQRLINWEN